VPSQMCASAGSRRVAVLPDDIAAVSVTAGWRASRRTSSWPAYPVAPATATRAARRPPAPSHVGPTATTAGNVVRIGNNKYTLKTQFDQWNPVHARAPGSHGPRRIVYSQRPDIHESPPPGRHFGDDRSRAAAEPGAAPPASASRRVRCDAGDDL